MDVLKMNKEIFYVLKYKHASEINGHLFNKGDVYAGIDLVEPYPTSNFAAVKLWNRLDACRDYASSYPELEIFQAEISTSPLPKSEESKPTKRHRLLAVGTILGGKKVEKESPIAKWVDTGNKDYLVDIWDGETEHLPGVAEAIRCAELGYFKQD